jgi:membrane-associated PAP2 superfamily phosphatase
MPHVWFAVALLAAAVVSTVPFWLTDLDIAVAARFFDPTDPEGPWSAGRRPPWSVLYHLAGPAAALLGLGSVIAIVVGARSPDRTALVRAGVVVLLTLGLGPGLLVNSIFKDHWGRPRPNHLVEFGGSWDYLPPLVKGVAGSVKSFPSGHASVGYAYVGLALVLWRRHRRAAVLTLAGAIVLGSVLGLTRMAAGNHFLSDVLWAGVMTTGVAMVLHLLIVDRGSDSPTVEAVLDRIRPVLPAIAVVLGALVVGAVLLATPLYKEIRWSSEQGEIAGPHRIVVEIDRADVRLTLRDTDGPQVAVRGLVQGFGLPGAKVIRGGEIISGPTSEIRYRLETKGTFTDLDARLEITATIRDLEALSLGVGRGDITVAIDGDPSRVPPLDLRTDSGSLTLPPGCEP